MSGRVAISGAILAGGRGRRIGVDKAALDLGDGVPFLDRAAHALGAVADEVIVVGGGPRPGHRVVDDRYGDTGALGGLATALAAASGDMVCVVGCDLPFASTDVFRLLLRLVEGHDAAVPHVGGRDHVMHAVYRRSCLPAIERALVRGDRRVGSFLPLIRLRRVDAALIAPVDPSLDSLMNVNTPGDLARARECRARAERSGDERCRA